MGWSETLSYIVYIAFMPIYSLLHTVILSVILPMAFFWWKSVTSHRLCERGNRLGLLCLWRCLFARVDVCRMAGTMKSTKERPLQPNKEETPKMFSHTVRQERGQIARRDDLQFSSSYVLSVIAVKPCCCLLSSALPLLPAKSFWRQSSWFSSCCCCCPTSLKYVVQPNLNLTFVLWQEMTCCKEILVGSSSPIKTIVVFGTKAV